MIVLIRSHLVCCWLEAVTNHRCNQWLPSTHTYSTCLLLSVFQKTISIITTREMTNSELPLFTYRETIKGIQIIIYFQEWFCKDKIKYTIYEKINHSYPYHIHPPIPCKTSSGLFWQQNNRNTGFLLYITFYCNRNFGIIGIDILIFGI